MCAFKLKIALKGSKPRITRTVAVPEDMTFGEFHEVIQTVMPWTDDHLHEFQIPSLRIRLEPDDYIDHDPEEYLSEADTLLSDFRGMKFQYIYDFGDWWVHEITWLKDIDDHDVPRLLKYTEECPPEDCGGLYGYYRFRSVLQDPDDPEYKERKEWWGEPEPYDMDMVNLALSGMSRRRHRAVGDADPSMRGSAV